MQVITRGFAYGMTKPAVDALYTRVPRETSYKGKNFVETAVWRFGDLVVTSAVSGLRMLGWGIGGLALAGAGIATLAVGVYRPGAVGSASCRGGVWQYVLILVVDGT